MKRPKNPELDKLGIGRDRCVESSCREAGVSAKETKNMTRLLGKRAPLHEIAGNMSGRPTRAR